MLKLQTANTFYDNVPFRLQYQDCSSKGTYVDICVLSKALRQLLKYKKYKKYLMLSTIRDAKGVSQSRRTIKCKYITIRASRTL